MWSGETKDRPRERLMRHGPSGLSDVELVAAVLRNGRSGQNAVELARTLLDVHGDIRGLARARADLLAEFAGVGPAKAAALAAAFELGARIGELGEAVPLRRAEDVAVAARREARGARREELLLLVADLARRLRWTVPIGEGPLTRPGPPVRRAIDAVVAHGGAAFALARMTTDLTASVTPLDAELVRRIKPAAICAGLRFLDYVVVADTDWCGVVAEVPVRPDPPPRLPPRPPLRSGAAGADPAGATGAAGTPDAPGPPGVSSRSRPPPGS
jgi:DNA repair protein RadC